MTGEEPVHPDEWILRCIHRDNTDPSAPTLVKRCEFEPKKRDVDGLSFYRERYTSVEALVNATRSPGDVYYPGKKDPLRSFPAESTVRLFVAGVIRCTGHGFGVGSDGLIAHDHGG